MKNQIMEIADRKMERVYQFIVDFIKKNGYSPSFREISDGTDIKSVASVRDKLKLLEYEGLIRTKECQPRTISLTGYKFVKSSNDRSDARKKKLSKKVCNKKATCN